MLREAWHTPQHVEWQIDWSQSPGGLVVAEVWRAEPQMRLEILEAAAPALVGETLMCDGGQCWHYNRLAQEINVAEAPPRLAPVTDAFGLIEALLQRPVQAATQARDVLEIGPTQRVSLTYSGGDALTMWLDEARGLPLQIDFASGQQQARLTSRNSELLPDAPPELFKPGPWLPQ